MYSDEKNTYLKYFYLIDTERLAEKVNTKLNNYNSTEPDDIFQVMFSEIIEICAPYLNFVYSADSFNHTGDHSAFFSQTCSLYKILENHCILHGFLSAVKEESNSTVTISGAKDSMLRSGYFKTKYFKDKIPPASNDNDLDKTIYQNYNVYKKRFQKHPDSYSYCILKKHSTDPDKKFLTVPGYDGNWGCFIYTESRVHTLDKNISEHNSDAVLKNYGNLFEDAIQWCQKNDLLPEDRLLFESAMEQIYGFRFFTYAAKLLNKVYSAPSSFSSTDITYKDLEGSILLSLIQQASRLPILYNRSVFLDHAIYSVIRSRYQKDWEYQKNGKSLFSNTSQELVPKQILITSGFEQIRKYLQKLKYIAIPLLENVWDSLTDKLNQGDGRFNISTNTYLTYIHKNRTAIGCDYSRNLGSRETLCHTEPAKDIYLSCQVVSFQGTLPKPVSDSLKELLFDYFNADRFPIHQPSLYHLLTPDADITEPKKHTVEKNFYKYHQENILALAENITPSMEQNASHPND